MKQSLCIIAALLTPTLALAQEAELVCFSAGGPAEGTSVVIYGAGGDLLAMAIPPEGDAETMESALFTGFADTFPALEETIVAGLAELPEAPDAETCEDDGVGPVAIGVAFANAEPLIYDAPCISDEFLALNDAVVAATGDPVGQQTRTWGGPVVPALRDTCRMLP